ncbi:GHKL domain-containing protein, partial [Enterococcus mundtii]|uniref:GHKL domain-containing protein n=1 Tax=Enterococcus mundtii TaxID=53346 RepID=UPI001594E504
MYQELNKIKIVPLKSILPVSYTHLDVYKRQSILLFKIKDAKHKNININFHVEAEISKVNINILDFVRVLSNVIDNAIDACLEVRENPYINILIYRNSDFLLIEISNSYLNKGNIFIDSLRKKGFTTKNNHHGLGSVSYTHLDGSQWSSFMGSLQKKSN